MKPVPSYLSLNRHGTYYFRIVIPAPVRALVHGKREIRRSLKTDSQRLALKRARQHAVRFESVFDRVLRMKAQDEIEFSAEDMAVLEELLSKPEAGLWADSNQASKTSPEPQLSDSQLEAQQRRREVERLLTGAYHRPVPHSQEPLARRLLELSLPYQPTELRAILPRLRDELVLRDLPLENMTSSSQHAQGCDPAMAEWTLYQVWEHQLARDRADTSSKGGQANHGGTLEERKRRARVMTVLTQHKPVTQLSKQDWQAAYDAARKMKIGATASLEPTPTPLHELITDDPEQRTGHERASALITSMKQIQEHARFLDLTTVRSNDLIIKPIEKRVTPRSRDGVPFSADDIETIFSGYIYRGAISPERTKAYPFWFWLPLLAYFTGARTNEIAQLDTADIKDVSGHPCFDFCPDDQSSFEAKRIKTGEARLVPIHPRLIELGFIEYVADQRRARQKKLFGDGLTYLRSRADDTAHNKEGWAKSAGKFFNEQPKGYLVSIGVHLPHDGKSLYSFRHTLETNLRNARRDGKPVDQSIIDAITGHASQTIASKHYDGGATVEHKLTALMHLPVPAAVKLLISYKANFVDRFGDILTKSMAAHRKKHPRTV
ncbi:DUF6538 domain-containing protein [Pseudomonas rhodesiae]|uniref:DUF6538 domain-containing protein n=1 Tax=Pseudomonas rhodesiae TaxID=76760 RepID=UPI00241EC41C|nr:DUF6538 domain-containing protein [Pseudomonas rhodesiae]